MGRLCGGVSHKIGVGVVQLLLEADDVALQHGDGGDAAAREFTASCRWCGGMALSVLPTLLAPKMRWTLANCCGSSAGKYGAKMQSGRHFRRRNLQAAQGGFE
nr:hypothetical protein Iba_scaffold30362CG0050 [Ipomoea batatas]GME19506.1 hypothetical protein Iba_scaffold23045CG0060 [Ipomoea batatas]